MANPNEQGELVKRFIAPSMRRALQMVSEELGSEAVILSSQKTTRGVEVVVSLEPDYATRGIDVRRQFGQNFDAELDAPMGSDAAWRVQAGMEQAVETYGGKPELQATSRSPEELANEIEAAREKMLAAKRAIKESADPIGVLATEKTNSRNGIREDLRSADVGGARAAGSESVVHAINRQQQNKNGDDETLEMLQTEIADMRLLLEQQLWRMADQPQQISSSTQFKLNQIQSPLADHLHRLGLEQSLRDELQDSVVGESRPSVAWRNCMANLSRRLPVVEDDLTAKGGVFAFVGPTGVGKTTTIAKLAAKFVLQHGQGKVAIVTTDTYRVGAHDQLRSLGRILGVPVRIVNKENSIVSVVASLKQFPLVLVDTAGFRQGDPLLKQQLKQLDACPFMKRVLVLACNSQYQTMKASVHAYSSQRKVDACVLSKLDESSSLGEAMSVVLKEGLPLAYTTHGQDIPADIDVASAHGLVAKAIAMLKQSTQQQNMSAV